MAGSLYIVSTPIGNYDDITLRAINVLKTVDFVICEEYKEANRLLSHYQLKKEICKLNEHNEKQNANDYLLELISGRSAALISDCGTPLFSDPGNYFIDLCISAKIEIVPVIGANSLIPALIMSNFGSDEFYFAGWLSPKKDERKNELLKLKRMETLLVIYDTPYRLKPLLTDIVKLIGKNKKVALAFNISMKDERYYRMSAGELLKLVEEKNLKGEYVLILDNRKI